MIYEPDSSDLWLLAIGVRYKALDGCGMQYGKVRAVRYRLVEGVVARTPSEIGVDSTSPLLHSDAVAGVKFVHDRDVDSFASLDEAHTGLGNIALKANRQGSIGVRVLVPGLVALVVPLFRVWWVNMSTLICQYFHSFTLQHRILPLSYLDEERVRVIPSPTRISKIGPLVVYTGAPSSVVKSVDDAAPTKCSTTYAWLVMHWMTDAACSRLELWPVGKAA